MFPSSLRRLSQSCTGARANTVSLRSKTLIRMSRQYSTSSDAAKIFKDYVVTPKQLNDALSKPQPSHTRIIPLSAAWFLPNDSLKRTGPVNFRSRHIPNSRFFDLDGIKNDSSPLPHMLPRSDKFAQAMADMGILNSDTIVVYDTKELGLFSAPRVAWTLRVLQHERTHLLNNFRIWCDEGLPTQTLPDKEKINGFQREKYVVPDKLSLDQVADLDLVKSVNDEPRTSYKILDARPSGRFTGADAEPRPGLESGHMPRSISMPFTDVLDPKNRALLSPDVLASVFEAKGLLGANELISSCGTGTSAAILDAAIEEASKTEKWQGVEKGPPSTRIYDGSWTEWASVFKGRKDYIIKD